MSFPSGNINFRRFAVLGPNQPAVPDQFLLDKLQEDVFTLPTLGTPEPVEYGWSGARSIDDRAFDFEHCVFTDCLHFALRIDTNKVPPDVKRSLFLQEEEAIAMCYGELWRVPPYQTPR